MICKFVFVVVVVWFQIKRRLNIIVNMVGLPTQYVIVFLSKVCVCVLMFLLFFSAVPFFSSLFISFFFLKCPFFSL